MNRNETGKHLHAHGRWMRPSERIAFLTLLERSDNNDCTVPVWMTPSLARLAWMTGYTESAICEALNHLEKHGWLARSRSRGGRGNKSAYQLTCGGRCDAATPADCLRPPKPSDLSDSLAEKHSDLSEQKHSDRSWGKRRSGSVLDEEHRRGGEEGG